MFPLFGGSLKFIMVCQQIIRPCCPQDYCLEDAAQVDRVRSPCHGFHHWKDMATLSGLLNCPHLEDSALLVK